MPFRNLPFLNLLPEVYFLHLWLCSRLHEHKSNDQSLEEVHSLPDSWILCINKPEFLLKFHQGPKSLIVEPVSSGSQLNSSLHSIECSNCPIRVRKQAVSPHQMFSFSPSILFPAQKMYSDHIGH